MNTFLSYLLETIVSLGMVYIGYVLVLRKETFFRLNRIYLLSGLFLSFLLPLAGSMGLLPDVASSVFRSGQAAHTPFFGVIEIPAMKYTLIDYQTVAVPSVPAASAADGVVATDIPVDVVQPVVQAPVHHFISYSDLFWTIYVLVTLILYVRFWLRLNEMWELRRRSETRICDGYSVCVVSDEISPYSFFSTLFISKTIDNKSQRSEIVRHEAVHIREGHSFDIVLIQFLKVFFWFNPFLYLVDRSLRETHEFQADAEVLKEGVDVVAYQHLLLSHLGTAQALGLSNNFNSSLIKKRLLMFTRKSARWAKLKSLLMLPLALTMVFLYTSSSSAREVSGIKKMSETVQELVAQVVQPSVTAPKQEEIRVVTAEGTVPKQAEIPLGKYTDTQWREYFHFLPGNKVSFSFNSRTGIENTFKGTGNYVIKDGYIIIQPDRPESLRDSLVIRTPTTAPEDSVKFHVICAEGDIKGAVVAITDSMGRIRSGAISDEHGNAVLRMQPRGTYFRVDYMGYASVYFSEGSSQFDYDVFMEPVPGFESTLIYLKSFGEGLEYKLSKGTFSIRRMVGYGYARKDEYTWINYEKE